MNPLNAIEMRGVSKRYTLGQVAGYRTLRETINEHIVEALRPRATTRRERHQRPTLWALREVDLEIERGEVVGIIGPNGAGKSTLVKILSRVTAPSEGEAEVRGRVGSLLEVGTGFHPELTGRENVYLSGAVLGMRKRELDTKYDEIVSFADVADFMDTPVKRYSSGMFVRLAFSVAIHLEPEILLVDEVLAVGDFNFQKKCLEKMRDAKTSGETVLMVSHNLPAVRTLCDRVVWLEHGRVRKVAQSSECVLAYLQEHSPKAGRVEADVSGFERPPGQGEVLRFQHLTLGAARDDGIIPNGEPIRFTMTFEVRSTIYQVALGFSLTSPEGLRVVRHTNAKSPAPIERLLPGRYAIEVKVENDLNPGTYSLGLGARSRSEALDSVANVVELEIADDPDRDDWLSPIDGAFRARATYSAPHLLPGS